MKFVILIFALLVNIKLCFKKLFDAKNSLSNQNYHSFNPIFLESRNKINKVNSEKNTITSEVSRKFKGYKMKISIFKETDTEHNKPVIIEGIAKLGKTFEIYGEDEKLKNQFSFLKYFFNFFTINFLKLNN